MRWFKQDELNSRTSSLKDAEDLHTQLQGFLNGVQKGTAHGQKKLDQSVVCDRIIRACIHSIGAGTKSSDHLDCLVKLADFALQGYLNSNVQQTPFYIERILFHLLKSLSLRNAQEACRKYGDYLHEQLASYVDVSEEYKILVKSCFALLWKYADSLAGNGCDFHICLSLRLQAVRFLVLLEGIAESGENNTITFPSLVARHVEIASSRYEGQQCVLSRQDISYLIKQVDCYIFQSLLQSKKTSGVEKCFVLYEVALQNLRRLCKGSRWREASTYLQHVEDSFKTSFSHDLECLTAMLVLMHCGKTTVEDLSMGLKCGTHLTKALHILLSFSPKGITERQAVIEGCSFVAWALEFSVKKNENKSAEVSLCSQDLLGLFGFSEMYLQILQQQKDAMSSLQMEQHKTLDKVCYQHLRFCLGSVYSALGSSQIKVPEDITTAVNFCKHAAGIMMNSLQGFSDQLEYAEETAYFVNNLTRVLYNQKLYQQALELIETFCQKLQGMCSPVLSPERLHSTYVLAAQCCRKTSDCEKALDYIVALLLALGDKVTDHMSEPVTLWVRTKADAVKNGSEDLRLRTLRDGLEGRVSNQTVLLALLEEELRAYKSFHGDTAQERHNTLCDLLDICHEDSDRQHERAVYLCELAQVLCYNDMSEQTDCSPLDCVEESLRLLSLVSETSENADRLLDDKAQSSLWHYICTVEKHLLEAVELDKHLRSVRTEMDLIMEPFQPNDVLYEDKQQDKEFVFEGIKLNLVEEAEQCKLLDESLKLWKDLHSKCKAPAVRSLKQTLFSIRIMAALYRLIGKPLQSLESYLLACNFSKYLCDAVISTNSFCHSAKLLLEMDAPTLAEEQLVEAESFLKLVDSKCEGFAVLDLTCQALRSQICCAAGQVEEGVAYLHQALQGLSMQKPTKSWCFVKADILQVLVAYLSLPSEILSTQLREKLTVHGWLSPEVALWESRKLQCDIVVSLLGNGVFGNYKLITEARFVDQGENQFHKWLVLADVLASSQSLISLSSRAGSACEAKAMCLESLKLTTKLQLVRQCSEFIISKAELELQKGETELCLLDLNRVRDLLELCTDHEPRTWKKAEMKIKPKKTGTLKKQAGTSTSSVVPGRQTDDEFLHKRPLCWVETINVEPQGPSSPAFKPKPHKWLSFLSHPSQCDCPSCSDPTLARISARWATAYAEMEAKAGNTRESRKLFLAGLSRCRSLGQKVSVSISAIFGKNQKCAEVLGFLSDIAARIYLGLALSTLGGPPEKKTWDLLEAGLSFLSSKTSRLRDLEHIRAGLLVTKAVSAISALAAKQNCSFEDVFIKVWAWKPYSKPFPTQMPSKTVKAQKTDPSKNKKVVAPSTAKKQTCATDDACSFDATKPQTSTSPQPSTPRCMGSRGSKQAAASTAKSNQKTKMQFQVFDESSPVRTAPAAPKQSTKTKSRFKIVFSDSSDAEEVEKKANPPQKRQLRRRVVKDAAKLDTAGHNVKKSSLHGQDEGVTPEGDTEILRRDLGCDIDSLSLGEPKGLNLHSLHLALPSSSVDDLDVESTMSLLRQAFVAIHHCPPSALYAHLCSLLALSYGDGDPYTTAFLHAESLSVTLRHQMMNNLYSKLRKLNKSSSSSTADLSDQMRDLQVSETDHSMQYLTKLEKMFVFPCANPESFPEAHSELFREQLKLIPEGLTVCMLSVVGVHPRVTQDTLLLTRLQRGCAPLSVRIPTVQAQISLSSVLQEFDAIQKHQKEISNVTDKAEWWEGRWEQEERMKTLLKNMECILGCWKIMLQPGCKEAKVSKQAVSLQKQLNSLGLNISLELLEAILPRWQLLSPKEKQSLAAGLCSKQPAEAHALLQAAVDELTNKRVQSKCHLVLILDKHLQKLSWENIPSLRSCSVSRLPSWHFLMSYVAMKQHCSQSVLVKGVDPTSGFYVLNPQDNLPGTEERFRDMFTSNPQWNGVIGCCPTTEQVQEALVSRDLYIYAGHGAGARFLDGQSILKLHCHAVSLLFGCSSAALAVRGELDGTGIVLRYLMAGCPLVLGNLWDVTDRDIDRFMKSMLEKWLNAGPGASIMDYVLQSREAPKLKCLIGASPIVYGLPVALK
ncbi:separin [Erpetoichthys calabaricus]|uniref:separin n=1 Tax=Erpetoichthys calabaricus TaxID=27687 RepID=UPI002234A2B8|nr:separin [Erpetoichthys calabaricus]XP_028654404.2 separin [Erpetoichthys calabaricus]